MPKQGVYIAGLTRHASRPMQRREQHGTILHNRAERRTILHSTAQYCGTQHNRERPRLRGAGSGEERGAAENAAQGRAEQERREQQERHAVARHAADANAQQLRTRAGNQEPSGHALGRTETRSTAREGERYTGRGTQRGRGAQRKHRRTGTRVHEGHAAQKQGQGQGTHTVTQRHREQGSMAGQRGTQPLFVAGQPVEGGGRRLGGAPIERGRCCWQCAGLCCVRELQAVPIDVIARCSVALCVVSRIVLLPCAVCCQLRW